MLKQKKSLKGCPICSKPAAEEFKPFCSKHCKNEDLINWAQEKYRFDADDGVSEEGDFEDVVEKK